MREFSAVELKQYLDTTQPAPLLIDVRQPWEYDVCQLENSRLIPMSQIPETLPELNKHQETVVICHHGIRSRSVGRYLEQAGFTNIINLSGGVDQWAKSVDNKMPTY